MNPQQTTQTTLTNAQLDALLLAPSTSPADPELDALRSVLADLRTSSEDAARQHFIHASINAKPTSRVRVSLTTWSTLATAALLLGVVTPRLLHRTAPPAQPVTVARQEPPPAVSDEALLASVQDDLDASVPSAMLPLTTSTATPKSTTQRKQK
jgi:hypothetical protein